VSAENIIDITLPRSQNTIPNLTGLDILCGNLDDDYLEVSEYFVGDDRYPMYIELDIFDDFMTDVFV